MTLVVVQHAWVMLRQEDPDTHGALVAQHVKVEAIVLEWSGNDTL